LLRSAQPVLKLAAAEWDEKVRSRKPDLEYHRAWLAHVLSDILELSSEVIRQGPALPPGLELRVAEQGEPSAH
jgi:hypothetical protein